MKHLSFALTIAGLKIPSFSLGFGFQDEGRRLSVKSRRAAAPGAGIPSLYDEHEKMLVTRGELEERLMSKHLSGIEGIGKRGMGSQGGFGAASSQKQQLQRQAKDLARVLRRDGVVRLDGIIEPKTAEKLRDFAYKLRVQSEELLEAGEIQSIERFADVLLKENRCDLTMPVDAAEVTAALREALLKSAVGPLLDNVLGGDSVLYELSCLMSDPGSSRQVVHPDTPFGEKDVPTLLTCFIALQDIRIDMGPTVWLPGSHTREAHLHFQNDCLDSDGETPKDRLLRTTPAVMGILPKGSCAIFDSRILHCGGANRSDSSRALFYFSFRNAQVASAGNPGSIRRDYIGKFALSTLQKHLRN